MTTIEIHLLDAASGTWASTDGMLEITTGVHITERVLAQVRPRPPADILTSLAPHLLDYVLGEIWDGVSYDVQVDVRVPGRVPDEVIGHVVVDRDGVTSVRACE